MLSMPSTISYVVIHTQAVGGLAPFSTFRRNHDAWPQLQEVHEIAPIQGIAENGCGWPTPLVDGCGKTAEFDRPQRAIAAWLKRGLTFAKYSLDFPAWKVYISSR
jgi:hypothetical protein